MASSTFCAMTNGSPRSSSSSQSLIQRYKFVWIALTAIAIVVLSFNSSSAIANELKQDDAGMVVTNSAAHKSSSDAKDSVLDYEETTGASNDSENDEDNDFSTTQTTKPPFYEHGESTQLLPNCEPNKIKPYKSKSRKDRDKSNENENDANDNEPDEQRWSQREYTPSTIQSHFNCFRKDTLCRYFYPADFFDTKCGIGRDYAHFTEEAEAMRKNKTLWNFMPAVGFPTLTMNHTCFSTSKIGSQGRFQILEKEKVSQTKASNLPKTTLQNIGFQSIVDGGDALACMTERLSMLHIHKAGGSSLHEGFNYVMRSAQYSSALIRHRFFTPSRKPSYGPRKPPTANFDKHHEEHNNDGTSRALQRNRIAPGMSLDEQSMYDFTRTALTHATKYPNDNEFKPEQHVIFALVRDPVERFISSIGQALGANGSTGNHIGGVLTTECVVGKESSQEVLRCIAKYVQTHGFWIELHFTPQVVDMAFTTMFADVPVAVFSFRDIKTVLSYFGSGSVQMRNGSQKNYRSSELLTNMSVDDYDEEILKIVCEIYKVDVIMQRSLGMEVEKCDPFIPK